MLLGRAIDGFQRSVDARGLWPLCLGACSLTDASSQRPDRANFLIATECRGESTRSWIIQPECQHSQQGFSVLAAGVRD